MFIVFPKRAKRIITILANALISAHKHNCSLAEENENLIQALSRTVTELRETKEKLAKAEATNSSNLEIKKNLTLRINYLQTEAEAASKRATEELKAEQSKTERFERMLSQSMMFPTLESYTGDGLQFHPSKFLISATPRFDLRGHEYFVRVPEMVIRFFVDHHEFLHWNEHFPILCNAMARRMGHDHGERLREEVLKVLQEIKCPARK